MNLGLTALCHRPQLRGHTSMSLVRGRGTTVAGKIIEHEIRAELSRILQSETFKNSERLQHFPKFAVKIALDDTTDQLKESVLASSSITALSSIHARIRLSVWKRNADFASTMKTTAEER